MVEYWIPEVIESGQALSSRAEHPLRWLIADHLDEMNDKHSEALRLWAWENLSYAEIARELGLAGRQSAHARVQSALKALRKRLERDIERVNERDSERTDQLELRGTEGSDRQLPGQARIA